MEFKQPKYNVGETVKFINDDDAEAGKVVSMTFNSTEGWKYSITAVEVDTKQKKLIKGIKSCLEDELVPV